MSQDGDQLDAALIGQVLGATYQVEVRLGRGGMGTVYRARHLRTGGLCAVKVLQPIAASDPEILRRFYQEAQTASSLRHPNIVHVMDFNQDGAMPYLVMELLDGEDLEHRMIRRGRLLLPEVLDLFQKVGGALQATHDRGVVHRDIKPQNLFLVPQRLASGVVDLVKVLDFGISKIHRPDGQGTGVIVMGTPNYMAPEMASGQQDEVDARSDQFSLAVVGYRALSGQSPFTGTNAVRVLYQVVSHTPPPLSEVTDEVSEEVSRVIARAMEKDKTRRYPSMAAFVQALEVAAARTVVGVSVPSGPLPLPPDSLTPLPPLDPPRPPRRMAAGWAGGAVLAVLLCGLWLALRQPPRRGPGEPAEPAQPIQVVQPAQPVVTPDLAAPTAQVEKKDPPRQDPPRQAKDRPKKIKDPKGPRQGDKNAGGSLTDFPKL